MPKRRAPKRNGKNSLNEKIGRKPAQTARSDLPEGRGSGKRKLGSSGAEDTRVK